MPLPTSIWPPEGYATENVFRESFRTWGNVRGNHQTVVRKKTRKDAEFRTAGKKPLRKHAEEALNRYFASLNGDRPGDLYELVLGEVEEPLFKAVMDYTHGNQSQAAGILGINRATLRKKLKSYALIR
jgi:Fis family transcriptional regulator